MTITRLFIPAFIFLSAACCSKKETLSDSCKEIIQSDSFYYALPLDEQQYREMFRLENYLTQQADSTAQTIDFDCAVVVHPTNERLDELRVTLGQDFDGNVKINTRHCEAVSCMIESKGIRTLAATGQFVRFITKKGMWDLNVQKNTLPDWKFILFKEGKAPVVLPSIMVTTEEVNRYFGEAE